MGDHPFDPLEIGIGGRLRLGQYVFGIKDVQALVFHRPHVEVINGDDHVAVQVVLQAIGFLVPAHGFL